MTKEFPMTNVQTAGLAAKVHSLFGMRHSLVIMVSDLVISAGEQAT
jgi:hypothetical protein